MSHALKIATALLILSTFSVLADQPIFNEMPRWKNGWGFQFIHEYRTESDLLKGDTKIGRDFREDVSILHLQGVYTWDKSIRITAKLPYVLNARREILGADGRKEIQHDKGIGDLVLALPLKEYFNLDGRSGSWTLAPQIRIPLGQKDEYEIYDHEWGLGLGLGYETETNKWIVATGIGFWGFDGDKAFQVSANLDLGLNFDIKGWSGHVKWENDYLWDDKGSRTWTTGLAMYMKITDMVHTKVSWSYDAHDTQGGIDHGNGSAIKIGIGWVF